MEVVCEDEIFPHGRQGPTYLTWVISWWRHQMETFSALLAICAENSPVHGEFPTQRPVTRSFDVFFHLRLNKGLSKKLWGRWFETLSCSLWSHRNVKAADHLAMQGAGSIFLSLAQSKLRLCSANHKACYFSNLACDYLGIVWAYSVKETENGPWYLTVILFTSLYHNGLTINKQLFSTVSCNGF